MKPLSKYVENQANWYSKTKFFGEPNYRHLALRINVIGLESLTKRSLLEWTYDNLHKNNEITGFENQFIKIQVLAAFNV